MAWHYSKDFNILLGKTLVKCCQGGHDDNDAILFTTDTGKEYALGHQQDCCEHVYIEDVVGELQDLVGSPLLEASEDSSCGEGEGGYGDSYTWTYYKLGTIKSHVNIRFYGSSNGYYSESVYLYHINPIK